MCHSIALHSTFWGHFPGMAGAVARDFTLPPLQDTIDVSGWLPHGQPILCNFTQGDQYEHS